MSLNDPIADMLTRIRNGVSAGKSTVKVKATKICEGIAKVLKEEGYILGYDRIEDGVQGSLRVELKYGEQGEPVINEIVRVSKPGCRKYSAVGDLPRVMSGLGIVVVSTSEGVMSDRNCRQRKVSGEVLCTVC